MTPKEKVIELYNKFYSEARFATEWVNFRR